MAVLELILKKTRKPNNHVSIWRLLLIHGALPKVLYASNGWGQIFVKEIFTVQVLNQKLCLEWLAYNIGSRIKERPTIYESHIQETLNRPNEKKARTLSAGSYGSQGMLLDVL